MNSGMVKTFGIRKQGDLVIIGAEQQEMVAGLDLFLSGKFVQFFLQLLVADVDYRKLLSVVTCGGVAYSLVYEMQLVGCDVVPFVAAYAPALKQGLVDGFHWV